VVYVVNDANFAFVTNMCVLKKHFYVGS